MLLSRDQIIKHMKNGTIVIEPFIERNLKTTSYDVTLGQWFWRERHPAGRSTVHNVYDEESTGVVWAGPYEAEAVETVEQRLSQKFKNVPRASRIILLAPGETVLTHTQEFIGGRDV